MDAIEKAFLDYAHDWTVMPRPMVQIERTWRERLLSWPWRPWRKYRYEFGDDGIELRGVSSREAADDQLCERLMEIRQGWQELPRLRAALAHIAQGRCSNPKRCAYEALNPDADPEPLW